MFWPPSNHTTFFICKIKYLATFGRLSFTVLADCNAVHAVLHDTAALADFCDFTMRHIAVLHDAAALADFCDFNAAYRRLT